MKTISDYTDFISVAFTYLSDKLISKEYKYEIKISPEHSHAIAETRPFGTIELYESNINMYLAKFGDDEVRRKTALLNVIAHEVSHATQKVNYYIIAKSSKNNPDYSDYIKFIELANMKNSLTFILDHRKELEYELNFIMDVDWLETKLEDIYSSNEFHDRNYNIQENWEQNLCLVFKGEQFKKFSNIGLFIPTNKQQLIAIKEEGRYITNNIELNSILDKQIISNKLLIDLKVFEDRDLLVVGPTYMV
ncbi:hypothetical protein [Megasphaera massiliensis]|uniref:hypothetical protein n=1 Tax=Megasphaera massiliensis TaxID=1232428 RepID=UPI000407C5F6|nr:hypothetical protein [Megasphaera massiliensis]MBS6256233.1 hypothetical protein [Megasphaera sp.]